MGVLATFLRDVLHEGRLVLRGPLPTRLEPDVVPLLAQAYRQYALAVAGPAIPFDGPTALAATQVLYQAGWVFLHRDTAVDTTALSMPAEPRTAAQHLSGDLLLRYLPLVQRRARALRPADVLTLRVTELLRGWPLSGVLADIEEPPTTLDFAGHPGLQRLYAERFARHQRPSWLPVDAGFDAVELVWHDLGRDANVLRLMRQATAAVVEDTEDD